MSKKRLLMQKLKLSFEKEGIHMMFSFKPKVAPTDVVRMLKGHSARVFLSRHPEKNSKFWGGHIWTRSYYMSTVGNMSKEVVERYINNQYTKSET